MLTSHVSNRFSNYALVLAKFNYKFKYSNVLYNAQFISKFSVDNTEPPIKTFMQISNSQFLALSLYQHAKYKKYNLSKNNFINGWPTRCCY